MVVMHVWFIGVKGHFGEFAGKDNVRPLFLFFRFSVQSQFSGKVLGVHFYGIFGLGGPGIQGLHPRPVMLVLSFSMLGVASLMGI